MIFAVTAGQPFRLRCDSPAALLLRHGWHVAPPPMFVPDLYHRLLSHDAHADVMDVTTPGGVVAVPVDMRNSQLIAADPQSFPDGYEPEIAAAIALLLPDDGVFIDAGANWGCFALQAALRPGFRGQVIAIEPAPRPADDLAALIAALRLPVQALRMALGDRDGTARLTQPAMTGNASIIGDAGVEVPLRRLDGLGLPPPHLIKLDIEGAELAALRGAAEILARHRPAVIVECRTDTPGGDWAAPLHLLAGHGHRLFALHAEAGRLTLTPFSPAARGDFPQHLNVLAIHDVAALEALPRA